METPTSYALDFQVAEISIKNFRGINHLPRLTFSPKLTLLVGENGVGKTTILECLAKMLRVMENKLRSMNSIGSTDLFLEKDIRHGEHEMSLEILLNLFDYDIIDEGKIEEAEKVDSEKRRQLLEKRKEKEVVELTERKKTESKILEEKFREDENTHDISAEEIIRREKAFMDLNDHYDYQILKRSQAYQRKIDDIEDGFINKEAKTVKYSIVTTGKDREAAKFSDESQLNQLTRTAKDRIVNNEYPRLTFAVYYPMQSAYQEQAHKAPLENGILNAWDNALEGHAFDFNYFFEYFKWLTDQRETAIIATIENALLTFLKAGSIGESFTEVKVDCQVFAKPELVITKNGTPLYASQMSSGERTLFSLVADLARRLAIANPKATQPLTEGHAIVIIDEVDLHLHPKLQTSVVPSLLSTFPNCQFIVTTHSPLILLETKYENIRFINEGKVEDLPDPQGRNLASMLLDKMGFNYHPIFYPVRVEYVLSKISEAMKLPSQEERNAEYNNVKFYVATEIEPHVVSKNDGGLIKIKNSMNALFESTR